MHPSSIYNRWLPDHLAGPVQQDEPARYAALIDALEKEWSDLLKHGQIGAATDASLKYLGPLKSFFSVKTWLPRPLVARFLDLLIAIVCRSGGNLAAQSRWAQFTAHVTRRIPPRRLRGWTTPWRPLFDAVVEQTLETRIAYEGGAVAEHRREHLMRLVAQLRRHFPCGSAAEIWGTLVQDLQDPQDTKAFDALGLLALFAPTSSARQRDGEWGAWSLEWARLWGSMAHCSFWDGGWATLFARLARDDVFGVVPWADLSPFLFGRGMWAFEVPVGGGVAAPPHPMDAPKASEARFSDCFTRRATSLARIAVHSIGQSPGGNGGRANITVTPLDGEDSGPGHDPALVRLEQLAALLDQYYHPSNGGRWTTSLSAFLRELVSQLTKRLVSEAALDRRLSARSSGDLILERRKEAIGIESDPDDSESDFGDDSGDEFGEGEGLGGWPNAAAVPSKPPQSEGGDVSSAVGSDVYSEDESGTATAQLAVPEAEAEPIRGANCVGTMRKPPRRAALSWQQQRRLLRLIVRLASQAQFSKDRDLARTASSALASMAELDPYAVLPLVHGRFASALDTVAAAGQLSSALSTFGLCVRPFLTHGFDLEAPTVISPLTEPLPATFGGNGTNAKGVADDSLNGDDITRFRLTGSAAIAGAMVSLLPGIDANDPPKSLAAFRFFAAVLSSLRFLPTSPTGEFPLDTETWIEDLLSHLFALLNNLDVPDQTSELSSNAVGDSTRGTSFLLDGSSMFRPFLELLFARLRPELRARAGSGIARFLLGNMLPSVAAEAATIAAALTIADPETAAKLLFLPILNDLHAETSGLGQYAALETLSKLEINAEKWSPPTEHRPAIGKAQEATLSWKMQLLSGVVGATGAACIIDHGARKRLIDTLRALANVESAAVSEAASHTLSATLSALVLAAPVSQHSPSSWALLVPGSDFALDAFLDRTGAPHPAPQWRYPTDDELSLADEIVCEFLVAASKELRELAQDGTLSAGLSPQAGSTNGNGAHATSAPATTWKPAASTSLRAHVRSRLLCMYGVVCGAGTALPDLQGTSPPTDTAGLFGSLAPQGLHSAEAVRARDTAAEALLAFLRVASHTDGDTLALSWMVVEALVAVGWMEHQDASSASSTWTTDERWVATRQLSDIALLRANARVVSAEDIDGDAKGGVAIPEHAHVTGTNTVAVSSLRARRRRPRWLVVEKTCINLRWRASSAAYRWWITASNPVARLEDVPNRYRALLDVAAEHALHAYKDVRAAAGATLERGLKRYPVLVEPASDILLRALAALPLRAAGANIARTEMPAMDIGSTGSPSPEGSNLLEALQSAARVASARAASAAAEGLESKEATVRAAGAASLLRSGRSFWRHAGYSWRSTCELMAGLLASAIHTAPEVAQEVSLTSFVYGLRFYAPQDSPYGTVDELLDDISAIASSSDTHWRHRVLASMLMLCVLPSAEPETVARAIRSTTLLLSSDAPMLRSLAATTLLGATLPSWAPRNLLSGDLLKQADVLATQREREGATYVYGPGTLENAPQDASSAVSGAILRRDLSPAARDAACSAILDAMSADGFWKTLFSQLSHGHVALARGDSASGGGLAGFLRGAAGVEDTMARLISGNIAPAAIWPGGRETIQAISEGWFVPTHAATIQALASLAPSATAAGLREHVLAALAAPRDRDAPAVAAAGEALAGLLAAGAPGELNWASDALRDCLATAPLDALHVVGGALLRYIVHHVSQPSARSEQRSVWAATSSTLIRLVDLSDIPGSLSSSVDVNAVLLSNTVSAQLDAPVLIHDPAAALRALQFATLAIVEAITVGGTATDDAHVLLLLERLAASLPGLARGAGGHLLRSAGARCASIIPAVALEAKALRTRSGDRASDVDLTVRYGSLAKTAASFLDFLVSDVRWFSESVVVLERERKGESDLEGMAEAEEEKSVDGVEEMGTAVNGDVAPGRPLEYQLAIARIAFFTEVVCESLRGGEGTILAPWLLSGLRPLLQLQELIPSSLASVQLSARRALTTLKYVPLSDKKLVSSVRDTLCKATSSELWTERAASLSFMQYFWFRSFYSLDGQLGVVDATVKCLSDSKLEVRELASMTLSGLIKGLPDSDAERLRASLLRDAKRLLPARRRRAGTADDSAPSLPRKHAAVLGLRSFVLSTPYDVPPWLPDLLMALVRLANEPIPISATVTRTLADFRRTHEESGLTHLRDQLTSEQWEAIRDVAHPVTYFV